MKVIGIQASPRKNGNCDILMDEVLKAAEENGAETTKYYLDDYKIEPCHACCSCGDGVDCVTDDDCNELLDPSVECNCNCHKSGISKFFFDFILFFQRLFGANKECACGVAHY